MKICLIITLNMHTNFSCNSLNLFIQGGPFTCEVFDPAGVRLSPGALEGAEPLKPHSFELDTSGCGAKGDLQLDIVHDKRSVMCALEKLSATRYRATFMPKAAGKHRVSFLYVK